jgi:hypothetical protein
MFALTGRLVLCALCPPFLCLSGGTLLISAFLAEYLAIADEYELPKVASHDCVARADGLSDRQLGGVDAEIAVIICPR